MASSSGNLPSVVKPDDPRAKKRDTMMVVQDLCDKWNGTPSYSTEMSGQRYRCKLTVKSNDICEATLTAEGVSSLSKNDAEQVAAWQMLPDLMTLDSPFDFPQAVETEKKNGNEPSHPKNTPAAQSEDDINTAIEAISGWPIAELKTLCLKNGCAEPTYKLKKWNFPFSKTVFSVKCRIEDKHGPVIREVGRYSLEDAKIDVAIQVLDLLKLKWSAAQKRKGSKENTNVVVKATDKIGASNLDEITVASSSETEKTAASTSPKNKLKKRLPTLDGGVVKRRRLSKSKN